MAIPKSAIEEAAAVLMTGRYNVHSVWRGTKLKGGQDTGVEAICCGVDHKLTIRGLAEEHRVTVPKSWRGIPTDVVACPMAEDLRLWDHAPAAAEALKGDVAPAHRRCNDPVQGGDQIQPRNAPWVGTLGCAVEMRDGTMAFLSNEHVLDGTRFGAGHTVHQPTSASQSIGQILDWEPIDFSQAGRNYIDAAVAECRLFTGLAVVQALQRGLGPLNPSPQTERAIGDRVAKSGRTTGVQAGGEVVGLDAVVRVGYGGGNVATFYEQVRIRNRGGGEFSGPGDSGSLVTTLDVRPYGLLFAGSPGVTIANPIERVVERFGVEFN